MPLTKQTVKVGDVLAELKREQEMRDTVYPAQVRRGKLSKHTADKRTAIIMAIIEHLEKYDQDTFISKIKTYQNVQKSLF